MKPIKLITHGYDDLIDKHWTEDDEAFIIGDRIVVEYDEDENELLLYVFPKSIVDLDTVDYYQSDDSVKRPRISFENFPDWRPFELSKSFEEILIELTKEDF